MPGSVGRKKPFLESRAFSLDRRRAAAELLPPKPSMLAPPTCRAKVTAFS